MEISNQFDGSTWVTSGTTQIEIFEGGANKYEAEILTTRYECKEITTLIISMCEDINQLDNMCYNLCNMFNGKIINE